MPSTDPEHVAVGRLADQAVHAIRLLNHRTRPTTGGLADPLDTAEIITALASMSGMLPQLLGQLAHWLEAEHHGGRLHVDALAPLPDLAQTVHALTGSLQHAIHSIQRAAEELDTAHQHAAHLATAEPATNDQDAITAATGPKSMQADSGDHRNTGGHEPDERSIARRWAGLSQPRVLRGLAFSSAAAAMSCSGP
jgi:hypothetical protein